VKAKKDALVQALTEKYGIRQHIRNSPEIDTYDFGTEDHSVEFTVSQEGNYLMLSLTYSDQSLRYKAQMEDAQRKADAENSLKEDFKKTGIVKNFELKSFHQRRRRDIFVELQNKNPPAP
jgi:hypothetical protein